MRTTYFLAAMVLPLAAHAADQTSKAKAEIQARYAALDKAFAERDVRGFEAPFAEDFSSKAPGRPIITRAQLFHDFEGQMKALKNVKWVQTIKDIKLDGVIAHVKIESDMKARMGGQDGAEHDLHLMAKTKNDWVKGPKGWQVKYSETLDLKLFVDGKPIKAH